LTSTVRFFTSVDDEAIATFNDCNTIPQIGSNIWVLDNRYRVNGVDYSFPYPNGAYSNILADVWVEEIE
jgi:hypothetical protein